MTAPFLQGLKKSVGNSIRVNIPGQNLLNTAPSSSLARRCRKIKRCVFPLRNISAETPPGRRPLTSPHPREPMMMDETFSHPAFVRIAVGISPLVMTSTFTFTTNPRCSRNFFPPPPAGFSHSQYVPGVKSDIDNMLEDYFLYPGDPGEAYYGFFKYSEKSVGTKTSPNVYVTPCCSTLFFVLI